jgi:hypothetical protein
LANVDENLQGSFESGVNVRVIGKSIVGEPEK